MPSKQLHQPEIKRGATWHVEYYTEAGGQRKRIRKSKTIDGRELNAVSDLSERENLALEMLRDLRKRLAPVADRLDHTYIIDALKISVELKRSDKWKTNKAFSEVARWISEFWEKKGWRYLRCNQVEFSHFQSYFDHIIVERKVRNSTHHTRKNNLRSLVGELVKRGYLTENFVSQITERPVEDPLRRPFSPAEFSTYLAWVARNDRPLYLATLLLGYLAIRPGEMRDLRVGAIDLRRKMVIFPASKSKNRKNSAVTIPEDLIEVLESFGLDQFPPSHFLFGKAQGRHNYLLQPRPAPVGVNTLSNKFRAAVAHLKKAGELTGDLTGVEFYSLKDTLAIFLLDNGIGVEEAMRHFRQSSLAVFQRYVKRLGQVNEAIRVLKIPSLPK